MPAILVTILTAFASKLVVKMMIGAGIVFLSYTYTNDRVAQAQAAMQGLYSNIPANIMGILGILKIPQSLSVCMSAIGIATFIKSTKLMLGRE